MFRLPCLPAGRARTAYKEYFARRSSPVEIKNSRRGGTFVIICGVLFARETEDVARRGAWAPDNRLS